MKKLDLIKYIVIICAMITGSISMIACGKNEGKNQYELYYTNSSGNKFVKKTLRTDESDQTNLVNLMLEKMNEKQKDSSVVVIKPENVHIDKVEVTSGNVIITFNDAYYDMKQSTEVLFRGAVVKELCQIEGIEGVAFKIGEQDAVYDDGTIIGTMNKDTFANDADENIGNVEWRTVNLYYANKAGDKLIKNETQVAYSKNVSLEKIVVDRLIKGPSVSGNYASLPADMRLLGISVNNRICYVNFSSEFVTEMVNVSYMLPVYSIVNSLCDLESVDGVKILINGNSTKTYRESINLDTIFYYNNTLIQ